MREILFYGFIGDFLVQRFLQDLSLVATTDEGAAVVTNSSGGDVFAGWGLISGFRDFPNRKTVKVHGNASSMMSVFLLFADETTCLEQTKFVLHRASAFNEEDETSKKLLKEINSDIRKAFEDKLDMIEFIQIGREQFENFSVDRFFDMTQPPLDVVLNAEQAKTILLIKNVLSLKPNEVDDINNKMLAATNGGHGIQLLDANIQGSFNQKEEKMKFDDLKKEDPKGYEALVSTITASLEEKFSASKDTGTAEEEAVKAEKVRVKAWLAWEEIAPEAVKAGIEGDAYPSEADRNEFAAKAVKTKFVASGQNGSADDVDTKEDDGASDDEKEVQAFSAEVDKNIESILKK